MKNLEGLQLNNDIFLLTKVNNMRKNTYLFI